jgi:MoxR-like ATPase
MQERQVTVDGETHLLEPPFMVVATQNPLEFEGTYPLPEAQLDRFTMRLRLGYPELDEEARMLSEQASYDPLESLQPVATVAEVRDAIDAARALHVDDDMNRYVVRLLQRTRDDERLLLGGSPRAGIAVMRVAKVRALMNGQLGVTPADVKDVAPSVLAHRLILGAEARAAGLDGETIVREALGALAVPR